MLMIYRDEHHTPTPVIKASAKRSRPSIAMARLATQLLFEPKAGAFATRPVGLFSLSPDTLITAAEKYQPSEPEHHHH
jgi:hypothetical protein